MKFLYGIIVGVIIASIAPVLAYILAEADNQRIDLSTDTSSTRVYLVNESNGGETKFTIYREEEALFTSQIISNSLTLIVKEENSDLFGNEFHTLLFTESQQANEAHYQLSSSQRIKEKEWRTSHFDILKGDLDHTTYVSEFKVTHYDSKGDLIEEIKLNQSEPDGSGQ